MLTPHPLKLLPGPLDAIARRFAPAWSAPLQDSVFRGSGLRLLRPLLGLLVAATVLQSVLHVINAAAVHLRVERINADADNSIDGWMGTLTTGLAAWAALQLALLAPGLRRPMLVLAGLCAYLSMDDMLGLHEAVARLGKGNQPYAHSGYDLWPLVYFPLLVVLSWLVLRTARSVERRTGRLLVAGLTALTLAVVLEALAPALFAAGSGHGQPLYESEVVVEEALELLGWGAMALGLGATVIDLLLARGSDDTVSAGPARSDTLDGAC